MLDSERDEYATNLAVHAANVVVVNRFSEKSLMEARRLLALAFHLSPRNKKAVVLNYQLGRSIIPEAKPGDYSPEVFARIILTRGQVLLKQPGEQNQIAGRFFIQLAAELDPRNDDAVYASEVQRLDGGALKWETITDVKSD